MKSSGIIKRSVATLAFRVILLEVLLEALYFGARTVIDYIGQFYGVAIGGLAPWLQLAILAFQVGVLVYLFARWANEYYVLRDGEIIIRRGVLHQSEQSYPFSNMQAVLVRQGLFSRILRTGSVAVFIPTLGQEIEFTEVPDPHGFARLLKDALPYPEQSQYLLRR
jgi:uncharacterized membrane protein YdbT with pleckstrin-like domain